MRTDEMLKVEDMRAEIERLKHDLHHYDALQTAFHNVNKLVEEQEAEIERLTDAVRRIDGINDYPANYSPAINAICDAILRPHLEPKPLGQLQQARAEVERLRAKLDETDRRLTGLEHLNAREKLELRAGIERLKAAISYVRMRSAFACEILNEFDNTRAALDPKP